MGPVHHDAWCSSLLWFNVLPAGNWGWRHLEPIYLPYHEPPMVIGWQRQMSFCRIPSPSHCGIEGNERYYQLTKETIDHDIDGLTWVHYADLKPLVNSYTQQLVRINGGVVVQGRNKSFLEHQEIPELNQSWGGWNHPASYWPYQGHQASYLVPMTSEYFSPL